MNQIRLLSLALFVACFTAAFIARCSAQAPASAHGASPPLSSGVIAWESLIPKETKTGFRRDAFTAPTATLDTFHCHISTLNPGDTTGAPHRHPQEEFVIVKEGALEVTIDGKVSTASTGSMIFYSANELEAMRNVGKVPATYYVIQFFTDKTPKH